MISWVVLTVIAMVTTGRAQEIPDWVRETPFFWKSYRGIEWKLNVGINPFRREYSIGISIRFPQFKTLDGGNLKFHGTCKYIMSESTDAGDDLPHFRILTENYYATEAQRNKKLSTLKSVQLEIHGYTIILGPRKHVIVNDVEMRPPIFLRHGTNLITVERDPTRTWIFANDDLLINFDGKQSASIALSPAYDGKVRGMLGNSDGNSSNDRVLPSGDFAENPEQFGNGWKDSSQSKPSCKNGERIEPVCSDEQKTMILEICNNINDLTGPFKDCHEKVFPFQIYTTCLYDLCALFEDQTSACDIYEFYAYQCALRGEIVDWRTDDFCPPTCGMGSHHELSVGPCMASCAIPEVDESCADPDLVTVSGCVCNEGLLWSGYECVRPRQCGCTTATGDYYKQGDTFFIGCSELCTSTGRNVIQCENIPGCPFDMKCVDQPSGTSRCVCPYDLLNPPDCSKKCSITRTGSLNSPTSMGSILPEQTKTILAATDSQNGACKVKVSARMGSQGTIDWTAVSVGPHPTILAKYNGNFVFDLWDTRNVSMRGPGIKNAQEIDVSGFEGWSDGSVSVSIKELKPGERAWQLEVRCFVPDDHHLLTFRYQPDTTEEDPVQLFVSSPYTWSQACFVF